MEEGCASSRERHRQIEQLLRSRAMKASTRAENGMPSAILVNETTPAMRPELRARSKK